jgi:hypothetical protein
VKMEWVNLEKAKQEYVGQKSALPAIREIC